MPDSLTRTPPVCVTGAAGFIGSHIVQQLLQAGYCVRGTVRDLSSTQRYSHLLSLDHASDRLELVEADLMKPESFDQAVRGCETVMHTASPYALNVKDPQQDLVEPAVNGTLNVLRACQRHPTVRRVIITSSMAAVTDEPGDKVLTEEDWNEKSSLTRNAYYYSKTCAERAAWEFVRQESLPFDVVTINPFMVIGPSLSPSLNPSNGFLVEMMTGKFPGIIRLTWGLVDVRDVALSHIRAMETPNASGRYLCVNKALSMRELIDMIRDMEPGRFRLPRRALDHRFGDLMILALSWFQGQGRGSYLRSHIGRIPRFDNSKIRNDLGIRFRPLKETVQDTIGDLMHWKHI